VRQQEQRLGTSATKVSGSIIPADHAITQAGEAPQHETTKPNLTKKPRGSERRQSYHPGALALLLDGVILEHPLHLHAGGWSSLGRTGGAHLEGPSGGGGGAGIRSSAVVPDDFNSTVTAHLAVHLYPMVARTPGACALPYAACWASAQYQPASGIFWRDVWAPRRRFGATVEGLAAEIGLLLLLMPSMDKQVVRNLCTHVIS
jgi:hypothetical protein